MKHYCHAYKSLYASCRKSNSNFLSVISRHILCRILYNKRLWLHQKAHINGISNIEAHGNLSVGLDNVGFVYKNDITYLNIQGKLRLNGNCTIGRGCRLDIGAGAIVTIGKDCYVTANSRFVIMNGLTIGDHCAISWDCQFLDEDFHEITYPGKKDNEKFITIGHNVWIGCGVKLYKGTVIPNGCVIASDSVVKGVFIEENTLIGGHPARIIRKNILWK